MATIVERVSRLEEHNEGTDGRLDRIDDNITALRQDVSSGNAALGQKIDDGDAALRQKIDDGDAALRQEINKGDAALRQEINKGDTTLRQEMAELRREFRAYFLALLGFMLTILAIMIGGFIAMANLILRIAAN